MAEQHVLAQTLTPDQIACTKLLIQELKLTLADFDDDALYLKSYDTRHHHLIYNTLGLICHLSQLGEWRQAKGTIEFRGEEKGRIGYAYTVQGERPRAIILPLSVARHYGLATVLAGDLLDQRSYRSPSHVAHAIEKSLFDYLDREDRILYNEEKKAGRYKGEI